MRKLKKFLSILICICLTFVFTGCFNNNDIEYVVSLDKDQIKAGVYLGYLLESYNKANNKKGSDNANVLTATIDGKQGADWIKDEALKSSKLAILVKREAQKNSFSLTPDETDAIQKQADAQFNYFKDYYENNGIGVSSIISMLTNQKLLEKLFDSIYQEGGTNPVPSQEIDNYDNETYVKIEYTAFSTKTANGEDISAEKLTQLEDRIKKLVADLSAGTGTFEDLAKTAVNDAVDITGSPTSSSDTYVNTNFINIKEYGTVFNEEFTKEIVAKPINEYGYKRAGDNFIVYKKVVKTADDYSSRRSSNLKEYKQEEYLNGLLETYKNYYFDVNQKAVDYYSPSKIKENN